MNEIELNVRRDHFKKISNKTIENDDRDELNAAPESINTETLNLHSMKLI